MENVLPTNDTEWLDAFVRFSMTWAASFSCCGPPENRAIVVPKLNLNAFLAICIFYINI